jgi:small multidrug resistance family-3 protein
MGRDGESGPSGLNRLGKRSGGLLDHSEPSIRSTAPIRSPGRFGHPLARLRLWLANYMQFLPWMAFALAAIFEVGGDAVVRMGIKTNNIVLMLLGAATLGGYGLIVNSVDWNFAKIFGVYVGVFALVAVLFGKFVFREQIPLSTWVGLLIIISGGLVIQFGQK